MGPFSATELINQNITKHTLVWKPGNNDWKEADKFEELNYVLNNIPPPLPNPKEKKEKWLIPLITAIVIGLIFKFISYDLIIENFGGHSNMSNRGYSEAKTVSYFFAFLAFMLVLIVRYIISKFKG